MTLPTEAHELRYLAGLSGFGSTVDDVPHWYCSCSLWRLNRRSDGTPFREVAERLHCKHVNEAIQRGED